MTRDDTIETGVLAVRRNRHLRVGVAVTLVVVALSVATSPAAAQSADPALDCVGSGGGPAYQTDSGLTVYENDTDAETNRSYFPDSETVRFEYATDALNLSAAGDASARLENGTGETTCLGDVNATNSDLTVSPDGENNLTLNGTYEGISFRDVDFGSESTGTDIAYNASGPASLTVYETGLSDGATVLAIDVATESTLDTATVAADGSVTFDTLPPGEQDLNLAAQVVDRVEISPSDEQRVVEGDAIDFSATATDTFGNVFETTDTEFDWQNTAGDGTFEKFFPGTYDVKATLDGVRSPATTVTVEAEPDPAEFEITNLTLDPADAVVGETVTVTATVANTGERSDQQGVELAVDGTVEEETSLALDGGESATLTFEIAAPAEPGGYEITAGTDDDSARTALAVEPELPAFRGEGIEVTESSVVTGETINVTLSVENVDQQVTQEVVVEFGDTTQNRTLSFDEQGTTSLTLFAPDAAGEYDLAVSIGEDRATETVIVQQSTDDGAEDNGTDDSTPTDGAEDNGDDGADGGSDDDADDDGPGFGITTVVVAVLATVVMARRGRNW